MLARYSTTTGNGRVNVKSQCTEPKIAGVVTVVTAERRGDDAKAMTTVSVSERDSDLNLHVAGSGVVKIGFEPFSLSPFFCCCVFGPTNVNVISPTKPTACAIYARP